MNPSALISTYGALWLLASLLLGWRALPYLGFVTDSTIQPLLAKQVPMALAMASVLGVMKGMTVFRKVVTRIFNTNSVIQGAQGPTRIFGLKTIILIGFMMLLGLAIRHLPYPAVLKAWLVSIIYPGVSIALLMGVGFMLAAKKRIVITKTQCKDLPWNRPGEEI